MERVDPVTGLAKMTLEDEDDEGEQKKDQPSPEELRLKAQREREEKQKRYDEARARILGTTSGASSPGTTTPPTEESKRSRGRGRGSGRQENQRPGSQVGNKELFDPNYTPGVTIQKRNGEGSRSGQSTPREEDQVIRTPRYAYFHIDLPFFYRRAQGSGASREPASPFVFVLGAGS